MSRDDCRTELIRALEPVAADHDMDVVDVEVVGSEGTPTVRVRIDHADASLGPISLDEVTEQNGWVADVIEDGGFFSGSYVLEVSSPGLSRPLRRPSDFDRFQGSEVTLTTTATEGRKRFTGRLMGMDGGSVAVEVDGERVLVPLDEVKRCKIKPTIDFNASMASQDNA